MNGFPNEATAACLIDATANRTGVCADPIPEIVTLFVLIAAVLGLGWIFRRWVVDHPRLSTIGAGVVIVLVCASLTPPMLLSQPKKRKNISFAKVLQGGRGKGELPHTLTVQNKGRGGNKTYSIYDAGNRTTYHMLNENHITKNAIDEDVSMMALQRLDGNTMNMWIGGIGSGDWQNGTMFSWLPLNVSSEETQDEGGLSSLAAGRYYGPFSVHKCWGSCTGGTNDGLCCRATAACPAGTCTQSTPRSLSFQVARDTTDVAPFVRFWNNDTIEMVNRSDVVVSTIAMGGDVKGWDFSKGNVTQSESTSHLRRYWDAYDHDISSCTTTGAGACEITASYHIADAGTVRTLTGCTDFRRLLMYNTTAGAITLQAKGSDTVNGGASVSVPASGDVDCVCNGTDWRCQ